MEQKILIEIDGDTMSILDGITIAHHYQLQRQLARGGMSEVYLAIDTRTSQSVAVKLVQRDNTEYCERFRREMYAVSALEHDHILPAFDYGEYGPWCYMVMPYIAGGTLRERLTRSPLSSKEAGIVLEQLASALQYAHGRGIIHRDIKPSNVLLRDGLHVYLADFGLAKHLDTENESDITQTGMLMGTPEYMAPELIDQPASISSDLYALGILLYQMLTGRVPFKSTTPMGIYWKHLQELPPAPSTLNPAIEPGVEQVLLHALEKEPQQRFRSAHEFAQAYHNAVEAHSTITIHPSTGVVPRAVVAEGRVNPLRSPRNNRTRTSVAASKKRVIALAACALLFLFALPAWLGFSLYSAYHHTHQSTVLSVLPLLSDHPVFPTKPTIPPTVPPTPTPTPTPTQTVSTQTGPAHNGQGSTTGTNQQATPPPQNNGNGGGDNEGNEGGNNNQHNKNGHHRHGGGGKGGGNGHKGKHKK